MAKVTKVKGLKTKGMRNSKWDKLSKPDNESAEKAPSDQLYGSEAKKIKKD